MGEQWKSAVAGTANGPINLATNHQWNTTYDAVQPSLEACIILGEEAWTRSTVWGGQERGGQELSAMTRGASFHNLDGRIVFALSTGLSTRV